ncbi:ThiF family adenylyltransferase [uncultured Sphaerochaeta sp.]|uniref:HesA/MoeB/ThiF family protein n=1 Tax=uncultured Sphaerochaeta sp. TaxID=886478 RepID=UPI002AA77097|nr:ThiF family adenylyltransferase [uncultured Sphaerochaeta sp.]
MIYVNEKWLARIRIYHQKQPISVKNIIVLSERIVIYGLMNSKIENNVVKRQEAAFGKAFNEKLQTLRAVVIGVGGTGSPMAILLARSGIGELILLDGDNLDITNMNRVSGFSNEDIGKNKAIALKDYIDTLGLNTKVIAIPEYLHISETGIDALSSSDIVFCCTDDATGRDIINQALYYYSLVLIDVGLTGFVDRETKSEPFLRDHRGRVSCVFPENGACLRCQNVINDKMIEYEEAVRQNPDLLKLDPETLLKEHYLIGGGEQAPGVGPFTTITAMNGLATFMNLIHEFRDLSSDFRNDNIWIDFIHLTIYSNYPQNENDECIYCKRRSLLLKKEEIYRLDMPSLGAIPNED